MAGTRAILYSIYYPTYKSIDSSLHSLFNVLWRLVALYSLFNILWRLIDLSSTNTAALSKLLSG